MQEVEKKFKDAPHKYLKNALRFGNLEIVSYLLDEGVGMQLVLVLQLV